MKLRTRFFLWIGSIFFLAFGSSLFFENYTTNSNLQEERNALRLKILKLNEEKREHIEKHLRVSISEDQAKIDSLLLEIGKDPHLGPALFINPAHIETIAPAHCAFLFRKNEWIDFMQTTKEGSLTSLLIPIDYPMKSAQKIPIDNQISWVLMDEDKEIEHPFIGVRYISNPQEKEGGSFSIDEMVAAHSGFTILFDPKSLKNWEKKPLKPPLSIEEIYLPSFLKGVEQARDYVNSLPFPLEKEKGLQEEIQKWQKERSFSEDFLEESMECLEEEGEVINKRIIELVERGNEKEMVFAFSNLFVGGEFGASPFADVAPPGIARFPEDINQGSLILAKEFLFPTIMFNDAEYLKMYPAPVKCKGIGNSIAIIISKNLNRIFFGNSLEIKGKNGTGFLTIGADLIETIEDLVLLTKETAFLVNEDKIIAAFSKNGKPIMNFKEIPFDVKMLQSKDGILDWGDKKYYYLHMTPFTNLDLHFFTLELEEDAFAFLNDLDKRSREVINRVSFNMQIIALVSFGFVLALLHRTANKIIKPITRLAQITEDVAKGRLEGIDVPQYPEERHDEIAILCESFSNMITGLKEKEKVKGILNKVVSPEIAQEIIKGNVQLGGEEKKVTVFFADIRHFTHMSSSMTPKEVIEMLNTCMTKISHVIDEFGGVIDKYVGDEVMALFGAPIPKEDSALKAIQCALAMIQSLNEWNKERQSQGMKPLEMGIGIHTGNVLAGNMGAENRLNYTVIGSNVNFGARLCTAAKEMEILISKQTLLEPHVMEHFEVQELSPIQLKGFEESFVLYSVKGEKRV